MQIFTQGLIQATFKAIWSTKVDFQKLGSLPVSRENNKFSKPFKRKDVLESKTLLW